ncbi:MAG: carboxypeptidase regulatory-like domain-containing protein [Polyangiaceae bacterium]
MPGERPRWLLALAAFAALIAIPLLGWLLLRPTPRERPAPPPPPPTVPRAPTPEEPSDDGLRLLSGIVQDADHAPISGATISIQGSRLHTVSLGTGRYQLEGVPLEAVTIEVESVGYERWTQSLPPGEPGTRETLTITLEPARGPSGIVLDPDGRPAKDAVVTCSDAADPGLAATTDDEGHFTLSTDANDCKAVARHPDFDDSTEVVLRPGEANRLRLGQPASIEGRVLDEDGHPIHPYHLAIESFTPATPGDHVGKRGTGQDIDTDDGTFLLPSLQAGTYILVASATGRPPVRTDPIPVAGGEQVRGIRIDLPTGGTLQGCVRDATSGAPIPGARVRLDALTLTGATGVTPQITDDDGNYQLIGIPDGPYSVAVSARGYVARILPGRERRGASEVVQDLELTPTGEDGPAVEYNGIGAMLAKTSDGLMIGEIVKGGPAEEEGLLKRDRILMIDGRDTRDFALAQAVQLLRGPPGSRVSIRIAREGEAPRDVVITRRAFRRD